MGEHMIKQVTSFLVLLTFSFTTMAAPLAHSKSVSSVLTKYDYLLTSHPQAHEADFQAKSMQKFKAELQSVVESSSRAELESSFDEILNEIPTQEKREVYLKVLKNSSKEELVEFLANPMLLADSLRGQSANFFVEGEPVLNAVIFLFAGLIIAAIISAVVDNAKYERFESYEMERGCTALYDHEEVAMKENAMNKCLSQAKYPETCRSTGLSDRTGYDTISGYDREGYWEHTETYAACVATAKADKKVE
jgi:hypothetical protein